MQMLISFDRKMMSTWWFFYSSYCGLPPYQISSF